MTQLRVLTLQLLDLLTLLRDGQIRPQTLVILSVPNSLTQHLGRRTELLNDMADRPIPLDRASRTPRSTNSSGYLWEHAMNDDFLPREQGARSKVSVIPGLVLNLAFGSVFSPHCDPQPGEPPAFAQQQLSDQTVAPPLVAQPP